MTPLAGDLDQRLTHGTDEVSGLSRSLLAGLRMRLDDSDDRFILMLSLRDLGDRERAAGHRELYLRSKADESADSLTGGDRRANLEDEDERLPVHEHRDALPH